MKKKVSNDLSNQKWFANKEQEIYDFECVDCEHLFDASEGDIIDNNLHCPECGSTDIIDICDE